MGDQPKCTNLNGADELTVIIRSQWARYIGTRAVLEAEGIVPADVQWPDRFEIQHWKSAEGVSFRLSRLRPEGAKGPRRAFFDVDWWQINMSDGGAVPWATYRIELAAAELRRAQYVASPAWQAARERMADDKWRPESGFAEFLDALIAKAAAPRRGTQGASHA